MLKPAPTELKSWSYSSAKLYEQSPRKYYHLKVIKDVKDDGNKEHLLYGNEFHSAAEHYVRSGVALPAHFKFAKQQLDSLVHLPGDKHCEYKMGLTKDLQPCKFFADDCWYRGIVDLLIINGDKARIIDYKTGKSAKYADVGQLELMALCIFKHFPQVKSVKAGLLFVVAGIFKPAAFQVEHEQVYWRSWMELITRIERSFKSGVWNAKKTGLCKAHCPVITCPHNGLNK